MYTCRLIYSLIFSIILAILLTFFFFFFNDTATTEIYTLSLHDALPISKAAAMEIIADEALIRAGADGPTVAQVTIIGPDRKSTRLNSSHLVISYAVFCLKKKKKKQNKFSTLE